VKNNNLTYPTVGVTDAGRAVISFTLVGADHYPSAAYAGLDLKSGAGPVRVAAEGKGVSRRVHQLQGVRRRPAADPLG
jgi:hypothetical protein